MQQFPVQMQQHGAKSSTYNGFSMRSPAFAAAVLSTALVAGCSQRNSPAEFAKAEDDFVYGSLSLSPVTASGQGLHSWNGHDFVTELDDLSFAGVSRKREFLTGFHKRLAGFDRNSLCPED